MRRRHEPSAESLDTVLSALPRPLAIDDDVTVRGHVDDALERDGRMLVLANDEVVLLGEVASAALRHTFDGVTVADLSQRLHDEFGVPPGGRDVATATRQILATLEGKGIVQRD